MSRSIRFLMMSFLLCVSVSVQYDLGIVNGDYPEAVSSLSGAESYLEEAYLSVLDAERTGGDVSELTRRLNSALEDFNRAIIALDSGDYQASTTIANSVLEQSMAVIDEAASLKGYAIHTSQIRFRNQLLLTIETVCAIVLLGFVGWRLFKDYYIRRMLKMKPEVANCESR